MGKNFDQHVITNVIDELLNIGIVTNVHDLRNHAVWQFNSLIGRFPPDIFAGKAL